MFIGDLAIQNPFLGFKSPKTQIFTDDCRDYGAQQRQSRVATDPVSRFTELINNFHTPDDVL
jgi:hypothetical protein